MVRYTIKMADNKESENETTEATKTDDNSAESVEASGSQETEKTSEKNPKEKENEVKEVEMDVLSRIEKELLECKKRRVEMEDRVSSMEQRLCQTMETMMRKMDFVLEHRPWLPPGNPPPQRWGFHQPLTLLEAAQRGDATELLRLLSTGDDCETLLRMRDSHGDTALHLAVRGGYLHATRILLVVGACVSTPGRRLRTPLHCAAGNGHLQIAERLLKAGAPVDAKDADGVTALAAAAMFGHALVVALLLKNGARPDTLDEKGTSPIFLATSGGHTKVVRLLLEKGVSVDDCYKGDSLLAHAAKACQWSVVKLLMDKGVSPERVDKPENSPLALAAKDGQGDIVRELLQKGAAANKEQVEHALNVAKTASVVWALVEAAPRVVRGEAGQWGLLFAAEGGRLEALIALLDAGVEIRARDSKGITPLHTAAWNGHYVCVRELLLRGADAQWKDDNGDTALHKAAFADQLLCIQVLLEAGAKKDEVNNQGKTPREVAASEAARRVLDGEGFFYDYSLRNATRPNGLFNQQAGNQSGTLFGMTGQSNNEKNGLNFGCGQSNVQTGVGLFGSSSTSQVNNSQGNVAFGMSNQTFGNETKGSSLFGHTNASQGGTVFGHTNASQGGTVFGSAAPKQEKVSSVFSMFSSQSTAGRQTPNNSSGNAKQSPSQGTGLFGAPCQTFGATFQSSVGSGSPTQFGIGNKNTLLNSGQSNPSPGGFTFGMPSVNSGTNGVASCSTGQTNAPTGSSSFGTPSQFAPTGLGPFSTNSSLKRNSQPGNNMFGTIGQPIGGERNVLASNSSDQIDAPTKSYTFGTPIPLDANGKMGMFGIGSLPVNKDEENSASLNSMQTNPPSSYSLFGLAGQSVNQETVAPSGYKVSRSVNQSTSIEPLKNVKGESIEILNSESSEEMKDESLKEFVSVSLKKLSGEPLKSTDESD